MLLCTEAAEPGFIELKDFSIKEDMLILIDFLNEVPGLAMYVASPCLIQQTLKKKFRHRSMDEAC